MSNNDPDNRENVEAPEIPKILYFNVLRVFLVAIFVLQRHEGHQGSTKQSALSRTKANELCVQCNPDQTG